jgi:hypothetical protein
VPNAENAQFANAHVRPISGGSIRARGIGHLDDAGLRLRCERARFTSENHGRQVFAGTHDEQAPEAAFQG